MNHCRFRLLRTILHLKVNLVSPLPSVGLYCSACCGTVVFHSFYVLYPGTLVCFSSLNCILFTFSLVLISVFLILSSAVSLRTALKIFICSASNLCLLLCFKNSVLTAIVSGRFRYNIYIIDTEFLVSFVCQSPF